MTFGFTSGAWGFSNSSLGISICDGAASACCAAFEADVSDGAVEAIAVGPLMQVLRQGCDGIKVR